MPGLQGIKAKLVSANADHASNGQDKPVYATIAAMISLR
jgi:hypothetical protein